MSVCFMVSCPDPNLVLEFLNGQLDGDAATSLEQHLDRCPQCRKVVVAAADAEATGTAEAPDSLIDAKIGNFRISRPLGRGGMGVVYLARHPDINREVAVKVLAPHLSADEEVAQRFLSEARILAELRHPNIVEVFDFGRTSDGRLYYVMEYLEGVELAATLARGRMAGSRVLRYLEQIGAGLTATHDRGIVHRDLNPRNIFVLKEDPLQLKLLDFGLAKPIDNNPGDGWLSAAGLVVGSPLCMAPEQAAGDSSLITARADIYALGVLLYWMLSGQPPFFGETAAVLISKHLEAAPPPLPDSVPAPVVDLVQRCLAKNPEDRPRSAAEAVELFAAATGRDADSEPRPGGEPRRRGGLWLILLGVLVVSGIVVWRMHLPRRGDRPDPPAQAPQSTAQQQRETVVRDTRDTFADDASAGVQEAARRPDTSQLPPSPKPPSSPSNRPRTRAVSPSKKPRPNPAAGKTRRPRHIGEGTMPF